MKPVRYTDYVLKDSGEAYRYVGLGDIIRDSGAKEDVYILCKVMGNGFDQPEEGRTRFLICEVASFADLFDESSPVGELTDAAKERQKQEGDLS